MQDFFSSNLFTGFATIITGVVVLIVYYLQKWNDKIQAARVLLNEIRIAENRIEQIKDKIMNGSTMDLPSVFPTENWKKYAHLFVSNFDQDELRLINDFYDYGEIIENFAKRNNDYFWITTEERAKITVQRIADCILESYGNENPDEEVTRKRDYLSTGMDTYNQVYSPKKTLDGIRDYLPKIPKLTTSSCGIKLKKLARM